MNRTLNIVVLLVVGIFSFCCPFAFGGEWSGTITGKGSYQFENLDFDWGITLNTALVFELQEGYYLHGDFNLKYQDENNLRPFRLNELYLQGSGEPWEEIDFKLGLFQLAWGASDFLSPLDVLNPRPFSLSVDSESFKDKIPVPGIDVEWYSSDSWSWEFFYQPYFVSNFIPSFVKENMLLGSLSRFVSLPEGTKIIVTEEKPEVNFFSPIWALRTRGSVGNFDVALSFQSGYYLSSFPYQVMITTQGENAWVEALAGYPRRSILGFEFQGFIEGLEGVTVRGDLAWIFPERWTENIFWKGELLATVPVMEDPYWKASLGIDYTHENFYLNVNYLLGNPWEEGESVSPYLYLVTNWESEEGKWKPFWNSILSLQDSSMVNIVGVEYKPKNNWTASLSYYWSSGMAESKLGNVADGVALEVKYSF
ncbi:MAG: DUF1302 family protein [Candidatus Caldatribacteriaceae bacterium]